MIGHSSLEAARLAGITFRQLDYWVRVGSVEPAYPARGSGSHRRWSDVDVDCLLILGRVCRLLGDMDHELSWALWTWLQEHKVWPTTLPVGRDSRGRWMAGSYGVAQAGLLLTLAGTSRAAAAPGDGEQLTLTPRAV